MTRSELIARLANRFPHLTRSDTELVVQSLLGAFADHLARGSRVEIRGFGTFGVRTRPARAGRNPKTGECISVPEKLVPHFKPGQELRECLKRQSDSVELSARPAISRSDAVVNASTI